MFVLDTSAVINLLGTAAATRLLQGLAQPCLVEERVISELKYHPIPGKSLVAEFEELHATGLLTRTRMSDGAYEVFVGLAAVSGVGGLGIGESAAISVAQDIGGVVVLDDRKARRRAQAGFPSMKFVSSTQVFLEAAFRSKMADDELRMVFQAALANASMGILNDERALVAHLNLFD